MGRPIARMACRWRASRESPRRYSRGRARFSAISSASRWTSAGAPGLPGTPGSPPRRGRKLALFRGQGELVLDAIGRVDVDHLTPLAALQLLASLQHRLRGEE